LLNRDQHLYVLALSLNDVRLFEGGGGQLTELPLAGIPRSLQEALGYDEYETSLQMHSGSSAAARQSPIVHGHGGADQEKLYKDIEHYFGIVARGIGPLLADSRAPLLLATVAENVPLYRRVNRHPVLLEGVISGNPDRSSADELARAAEIPLSLWFEVREAEVLERFADQIGQGRTAQELPEVFAAAAQGRVDTLLLDQDARPLGSFDRERLKLHVDPVPGPHSEDLLDLLTWLVLDRGGEVFPLKSDFFAATSSAVAILRY
jgi:hypothetical protein